MFIRTVRTMQPQTPVGIDWGNPFTRGLVLSIDHRRQNVVDKTMVLSEVGTLFNKATTKGIGRGSSATAYYSNQTRNFVAATNTSFAIVGTISLGSASQTNKYLAFSRDTYGTGNQAAVLFGFVANKVEFFSPNFTGSDPRTGSQIAITDTLPHTFGYSYTGSLWSGYLDGVQVFSVTRTFNLNIFANVVGSLLSANGSSTADAVLLQWSTYNIGLDCGAMRSLTANPWQIFLPQSRLLFVPAGASVTLPTIGRPISDTIPGLWTPSTGADLFACIDEATPSDVDYISVASASMCEMALDTTAYPGTANQVISYRASSTSGSTLTVRLRQAGATIASWSHALTGTDTLYSQTLTSGQIAALANGSVSVQLEAS